jgi:hypothetical protein
VRVGIRFEKGPIVTSIDVSSTDRGPQVDAAALLGRVASSGFRAAVDAETTAEPGSLVYLLLDEAPAATLVGGYSVMHAVHRGDLQPVDTGRRRSPGRALQVADLCAGWQTGGVIMTELASGGGVPQVTGPEAPELADPSDPLAWHETGPLAANGVRRRRRIDVAAAPSGIVEIDAFFRDSHMSPGGPETILHEYTIHAVADTVEDRIIRCSATPRVLPWRECPQAAASATRLAELPFAGLRRHVRAQFTGPPTCTHLNDALRGLEDIPHLAGLLE